eukprot:3700619-Prymnesium_polylepis.1
MRGQLCFQDRLEHDLEWWAVAQAHPTQVLWLTYEQLVREPASHLRALAAFLGLQVTDDALGRVEAAVQLPEAKRRYLEMEGMRMMLKRGECGVYREYFDDAALKRFDELILSPLQAAGVPMVLN